MSKQIIVDLEASFEVGTDFLAEIVVMIAHDHEGLIQRIIMGFQRDAIVNTFSFDR
jgi:hypothetical protein